jgi:hypothetical protein
MTDTLDAALQSIYARGHTARIAYSWFTADSWPRLLAIAADRASLPDTFEGFERRAGERFNRHIANGVPLERVLIDVDALGAFCAAQRIPVDARSRSAFAALVLARRDAVAGRG